MKTRMRRYAILAALLLGWLPVTWAQSPPRVEKITLQHVGPQATSDDLIRANIRVKLGDPYVRTSVDDDVRTLYATGYFYNIRVGEELTPGGVALTYVLQGKPTLTEIQFAGNTKFTRSRLLKKVTSKVGEPLDERKLFSDSQEILKYYQTAGYQKTQVKAVPNVVESAGTSTVTFEIVESPRIKIERLEFVGAQAFSQSKLRKVLKTHRRWMFSWLTGSGVLKDEQFEDDKEKLADFYRAAGYIDFELKEVQFDQINPKWMVIRLVVAEGRQYKVGAVAFQGNQLFTADEIRQWVLANKIWIEDKKGEAPKDKSKTRGLKLNVGATFTPQGLNYDLEALQDFYGARGYLDTQITVKKTPNTELGTLDLVYDIQEGSQSFIEQVQIKGNIKTKDRVIRRELAVAPGETFDMVRVKLSQRRLEGLNYFEKVEAQAEPTDVPNRKNLVVGVEEKNTGNMMVGAGFSTVDNVVGFIELSQGNFDLFKPPYFMGAGQKFRLRTQIGTLRQDYVLTFIEPWFLGKKLAFQVDLYHREMNYLSDVYDERQTGARLGLTRALGSDFLIGGISYTLENIGLVNVSDAAPVIVKEEQGSSLISKVGTSIAYDTRNSATIPNKGQRTELLADLAGGPFGGEKDFYKLELRTSWYFRGFYEGHVLELTGRTGVVEQYGDSDHVPFFERWFLGGLYTLRGYKYRHVGPRDPATGEPIGGSTYGFASAEYSIPIIDRLRFALFYDIGVVNLDAYDFSLSDFNDNWGVGLRIDIPHMGPLRFDYGIPITHGPNSGNGRFQFGVGYTREF